MISQYPDLTEIFRSPDQSALLNNYVVSEDPPDGAWSHHSAPQSPLGRFSFPEVLTVARGEVYTRAGSGRLTEHMLLSHEWLPWHYVGEGGQMKAERTVARDIYAGRVTLREGGPGLLVLECAPNAGLEISMSREGDTLRWEWNGYTVLLSISGADGGLLMSDDPASLKRRFAGYEDVQFNEPHMNWVLQFHHRIWIGAVFNSEIEVRLQVFPPQTSVAPSPLSFAALVAGEKERWERFFADEAPPLHTDDPVVRDTYYFAWLTLWSNRCSGGSWLLKHPYTSPARLSYGSQWLWDSTFHATAYRHLADRDIAYQELRNFWPLQKDDGCIPGCLVFTHQEKDRAAFEASPLTTQPPVIGFILQLFRDKPGWPADLQPLYESLVRYAGWFASPARDSDGDGLSEWFHCFENGLDQSPRWDDQKLDASKTIDAIRPVGAIDLNVWLSELWRVVGDMAEQLGMAEAAAAHHATARALFTKIDELLWNEGDGMYYDIESASRKQIRVKTVVGFMPLLSPYIQRERAERLVHDHLMNRAEFWPDYPIPSVALNEPTFNPIDMWRGPSWVNTNWMVVECLRRSGFSEEARRLAGKTIDMVGSRYQGGRRVRSPRFYEWYHPRTGEALGNSQYSWSTLVIDLILRMQDQSLRRSHP